MLKKPLNLKKKLSIGWQQRPSSSVDTQSKKSPCSFRQSPALQILKMLNDCDESSKNAFVLFDDKIHWKQRGELDSARNSKRMHDYGFMIRITTTRSAWQWCFDSAERWFHKTLWLGFSYLFSRELIFRERETKDTQIQAMPTPQNTSLTKCAPPSIRFIAQRIARTMNQCFARS